MAIEPDAGRATFLREALRGSEHVELEIVARIDDAIRSITARLPDLVMTSTFFPPAEEAALASHVRTLRGASHVQIICVPYVTGTEARHTPPESSYSNVLSFVKRRPAVNPPVCDPGVVREQIEDYLRHAVWQRQWNSWMLSDSTVTPPATSLIVAPTAPPPIVEMATVDETEQYGREEAMHDHERRRSRRLRGEELPSLWTVKLPWGTAARVVDISTRGALIESASKIVPGSTVDLQLLGEGTNLSVPARMLRAEVSRIDTLGVRYHIAAAFSRELDLAPLEAATGASLSPRVLVDLLSRVLDDERVTREYFTLRSRFESELRRLLRVRDIQIRETPMVTDRGVESVYFSVPHGAGSPRVLQAVFDPGMTPSPDEFRLLKAAAGLAGALMEFAPAADRYVAVDR
jgi:hypothetical protein